MIAVLCVDADQPTTDDTGAEVHSRKKASALSGALIDNAGAGCRR